MTLKIAITRAEPEAQITAQRVRELGGEPVIAPLLRIASRRFDTDVRGAQALLFTSINGVRAFADATRDRSCAVIAVGNATAEAATKAGFANVRSANGDVGALAEVAGKALDPARGKVIHVAGAFTAGDLTGALVKAGYAAEQRVAFEAIPVDRLPATLDQKLDVMLFHSARAVARFAQFGAPQAADRIAVCLGPRVASSAQLVLWKRLIVAPAPREEALLAAAFAA